MNKRTEIFFSRIVSPLIVAAILFGIRGLYSISIGEKFMSFLTNLPYFEATIFILLTILLSVVINRWRKYKSKLEAVETNRYPGIFYSSGRRKQETFEAEIFGLLWRVNTPEPSKYWHDDEISMKSININSIGISIPPRCPVCKTELIENPRFLGGYVVNCPRNDFHTKSKKSFTEMGYEVKLIMRQEVESHQQK